MAGEWLKGRNWKLSQDLVLQEQMALDNSINKAINY